ncbi:uncharacterized protein I303_103841 [Kwoniella dejecticola CBS 10117]|uniref:MFS transporter, SP family, solute carrier family 2 (Myo-inositol transporter), member 13 n=1 Tax=Kwoniella dejecticola CBS 10117 TaxID=1296121 RepID=A0A1A6A7V4_9TREE|nr:MFS transporter, SP family, solute carrier family 2 (myo-inositol transporter), member 13 [Kwoniella dejecticola CBS 10117]OBR86140.1 MFS transporter, SP family, solute carrier family 2 (myo-inositol transporter), member 13 [Kwoniella dejecticola CBS 10117]
MTITSGTSTPRTAISAGSDPKLLDHQAGSSEACSSHGVSVSANTPSDTNDFQTSEMRLQAEEGDRVTPFLCFLIAASALAGFLYGYDTGVVGVALPLVKGDLGKVLSSAEQEIATAGTTIGAIFGSFVIGVTSDRIGRKWSMLISDFFFTVGSIIIASSYSLGQLIVGRIIVGVGVGGAAVIAPLYITELAPTASRGRCVGVIAFFIPFGQVVADAVGAGCQTVHNGWRILFSLGVVPSMLQLMVMHWLPESPRILILRGHPEKAREVLQVVYGKDATADKIDLKLQLAKQSVDASMKLEKELSFLHRTKTLWTNGQYRRSIMVVSLIQMFGQLTGFNALLYYAGQLFGLLGLSNPALGGLIPAACNAFFLFCGMLSVDRVGRRGLMVALIPILLAGLVWNIVAFYYLCKPTNGLLDTSHTYDHQLISIVIGGIVLFVAGYGATYSHIIWQQSEFLALEIRAAGSAIATTANWIANLVVAVAYLTQLETLTPAGTYGLYLGFSVVGYIFVLLCYPETKGLSIDETHALFASGFGVRKSVEMRKDKSELAKAFRNANADEAKAAMRTLEDKHAGRQQQFFIENVAADASQGNESRPRRGSRFGHIQDSSAAPQKSQ